MAVTDTNGLGIFDLDKEALPGQANNKIVTSVFSVQHAPRDEPLGTLKNVTWFPHDNGLIVTSHGNGKLLLWDASNLQIAEEVDLPSKHLECHAISAADSSAHSNVAVGGKGSIYLVDLRSPGALRTLSISNNIVRKVCHGLLWDPLCEFHLFTGADDDVFAWDLRKPEAPLYTTFPSYGRNPSFVTQMLWNGGGQIITLIGTGKVECFSATPSPRDPRFMSAAWMLKVNTFDSNPLALLEEFGSGGTLLFPSSKEGIVSMVNLKDVSISDKNISIPSGPESLIYDQSRSVLYCLNRSERAISSYQMY